jgi:hypothetical protein
MCAIPKNSSCCDFIEVLAGFFLLNVFFNNPLDFSLILYFNVSIMAHVTLDYHAGHAINIPGNIAIKPLLSIWLISWCASATCAARIRSRE